MTRCFDDGDTVLLEDIEGAAAGDGKESICAFSNLEGVRVKRIYYQYDYKRFDGKVEKREKQVFEKLRLNLSSMTRSRRCRRGRRAASSTR